MLSNSIFIFDLDGTLADSGQQIPPDILAILENLIKKNAELAIVSGGQYDKIKWQLRDRIDLFNYIFAESGAVYYSQGKHISTTQVFAKANIPKELLKKIYVAFEDYCDNSKINYTGIRVSIRSGLIYLTCSGMEADNKTRELFFDQETKLQHRTQIIKNLRE